MANIMTRPDMKVIGEPMWAAPCLAYSAQGKFSNPAQRELITLQGAIQTLAPLPLHLVPAAALHISIFAFVPVRWATGDKDARWATMSNGCIADLLQIERDRPAARLQFKEIRVTPTAIIAIMLDTSGTIAAIRERFDQRRSPDIPIPAYDIIHTTLARFPTDGVLAEDRVEAIESLPVAICTDVTEVVLVRERIYPSLEFDVLATARMV